MKKTMIHLLMFGACALLFAFGCGKSGDSNTATLPDGSQVTTTEGGGAKVETPQGTAELGSASNITEADLNAPIYPGSKMIGDRCMKVETASEKSVLAVLETSDLPDDVAKFYEGKIKGLKFNKMEANGTLNMFGNMVELPDGGKLSCTISRKGQGMTEITIGYGKEAKK